MKNKCRFLVLSLLIASQLGVFAASDINAVFKFKKPFSLTEQVSQESLDVERRKNTKFEQSGDISLRVAKQDDPNDALITFVSNDNFRFVITLRMPLKKGKINSERQKTFSGTNTLSRSIDFTFDDGVNTDDYGTAAIRKLKVKLKKSKAILSGVIDETANTASGRFKIIVKRSIFNDFVSQADACKANDPNAVSCVYVDQ